MKYHLVTGACGFVGRNLTKRLLSTTNDHIVIVDDLSKGRDPKTWLALDGEGAIDSRVKFYKQDVRDFFKQITNPSHELSEIRFDKVFHFAAIVGGRSVIDGDPMKVALNLSIDAEFFSWACIHKPSQILYPSSSAAYPVAKQTKENNIALAEKEIDLQEIGLPDMTYGWSKITGEYLAKIAHEYYGLSVVCIRPFSGYGENQETDYPIPAIARRVAQRENPVEVWGTGEQGRDFVHIDDVVDVMLLAIENISDGSAINIGSGKLTSFNEIIRVLCKIAGYEPTIKTLLDKPVGAYSRYCDMSLVKQKLNWEPSISLEEGMERVYRKVLNDLS